MNKTKLKFNKTGMDDEDERQNSQGVITPTDAPKQMDRDWDPDAFPTSATPIFRRTALLVALILALCALVYALSDHSEKEERAQQRKRAAESTFLGEEPDEGVGAMPVDPGQ